MYVQRTYLCGCICMVFETALRECKQNMHLAQLRVYNYTFIHRIYTVSTYRSQTVVPLVTDKDNVFAGCVHISNMRLYLRFIKRRQVELEIDLFPSPVDDRSGSCRSQRLKHHFLSTEDTERHYRCVRCRLICHRSRI